MWLNSSYLYSHQVEKSEEKEQQQKALEELQKQKEQKEKEQEQQQGQLAEQDKEKEKEDKPQGGIQKPEDTLFSQLNEEQQQSMQQYLNQIKDDPAYLLRRKFYLNSTRSKDALLKGLQQPGSGALPTSNTQVQQTW